MTSVTFDFSYFSLQHEVPHGKHAMILVKQTKGNLIWISSQDTGTNSKPPPSTVEKEKKFEPRLKTWSECDNIQVMLTISKLKKNYQVHMNTQNFKNTLQKLLLLRDENLNS